MMVLEQGCKFLRSRYEIIHLLHSDENSQTWKAIDDEPRQYVLKLWPFEGNDPNPYQRALWDAELRTLYRLGSSSSAEETLVIIKDAGVDREARAFVMVLAADGYSTLAEALRARSNHPWLRTRDATVRRQLWEGVSTLAKGLNILHEQRVLHRNIQPETVYLDIQQGPTSFRLGGFEWSLRLGVPSTRIPPINWSTPPEALEDKTLGYTPERDWFSFGMLLARCFTNLEGHGRKPHAERYLAVSQDLSSLTAKDLTDLERDLILRLIDSDPGERLYKASEISRIIAEIIDGLEYFGGSAQDTRPLVLAVDQRNESLIGKAISHGYQPSGTDPHEPFNPQDTFHVHRLFDFLRRDLAQAQISLSPGTNNYILCGRIFTLRIRQFEFPRDNTRTWNIAYCTGLGELRIPDGSVAFRDIPPDSIVVHTVADVHQKIASRPDLRSWERLLPGLDRSAVAYADYSRFHEFVRCTNQLELLLRVNEVYCYNLIDHSVGEDGFEVAIIEEAAREPVPQPFFSRGTALIDFLLNEVESQKPNSRLVSLTREVDFNLYSDAKRRTPWWTIDDLDFGSRRIRLTRFAGEVDAPPPPEEGVLRTFGLAGQLALIRRRKSAIVRLERHSYLLRSLAAPGNVIMDTAGGEDLPISLPEDQVDKSKQAALRDIFSVRPIFALQGPPGTGKTTLVAYLIREILEDDPVAQILITAQAHGAVDVLRERVRKIFEGVRPSGQPLAVRLAAIDRESLTKEGSVLDVASRVLQGARDYIGALPLRTPIQDDWYIAIEEMLQALGGVAPSGNAADFCEIVKRGANLTYCTTSDADLEILARETQAFDWAIVEEAGRAHGFDLALPLQAGHRWLLIGDHKQLPPYKLQEYTEAIARLDEAARALKEIPNASALLDNDWFRLWRDRTPEQREQFKTYAQHWLRTFEVVYSNCSVAFGERKITREEPEGAAAGQLSRQHRMHPAIGRLISSCYYSDTLHDETGALGSDILRKVVHSLNTPESIRGKAIAWLDIPFVALDRNCSELGPSEGFAKYCNRAEVKAIGNFLNDLRCDPLPADEGPHEIAVLSPYSQQVQLINRDLAGISLSSKDLAFKPPPRAQVRKSTDPTKPRIAYTVDGFQGNQADIIIVSLVRNNLKPPPDGLGFLQAARRMNVLFSRAERLLVLVGSWEFFWRQASIVKADDKNNDLWHWRNALDMLSQWFVDGIAVQLTSRL